MFWEEKIDRLAKKYNQGDFNVPFTIATSILKKIEDQFIIKHTSEKHLNDWPNNIKFTNDFYLIDKKYNWFTYFNRSPHSNEISIYKSSLSNTPLG